LLLIGFFSNTISTCHLILVNIIFTTCFNIFYGVNFFKKKNYIYNVSFAKEVGKYKPYNVTYILLCLVPTYYYIYVFCHSNIFIFLKPIFIETQASTNKSINIKMDKINIPTSNWKYFIVVESIVME